MSLSPTASPIADQFEAWCDRQVFTPDQAEHAHHAIAYLRMAEDQPLPAPLRAKLAEHIATIHEGR